MPDVIKTSKCVQVNAYYPRLIAGELIFRGLIEDKLKAISLSSFGIRCDFLTDVERIAQLTIQYAGLKFVAKGKVFIILSKKGALVRAKRYQSLR